MAGKTDDDQGTEGDDGPDFAKETRIVDFGQAAPIGEMMNRLTSGDPLPPNVAARFRAIKGPGANRITEMHKPIVILGRVEDVADVLVEDEAASRYHASVTHRGGKFILTDMDSTNGTFVNRKPVREIELRHGDQIRIGITVLVFEVEKPKGP